MIKNQNIILEICKTYQTEFDVVNNISTERHYIGSMLPDIILYDKNDKTVKFAIEVKEAGEIARCLQDWKVIKNRFFTLYLIVPNEILQHAKSVAEIVGIKVQFGSYLINNNQITINYE